MGIGFIGLQLQGSGLTRGPSTELDILNCILLRPHPQVCSPSFMNEGGREIKSGLFFGDMGGTSVTADFDFCLP